MKPSFYRVSIFVACLFALPMLSSMAEAAPVKCGCYNLNALCGKLGGRPKAFARYGLFCVIKGQSASYVHTLSYRMVNARQDCGMFMKKLGNNLGKEMKRRKLLLNSKCQPLGAIKLCPVNKSFHVRYKCKCPKGTRFGAVSAAYRMCKTLVPPSCGVNRQFRAGTYCRCPKGTKMARARHHLFRICKPVQVVKLCPVNKSFHVRYKCKCPKGTRFGAVSAAYRMCKTLVPPSCGVNRQFRAGTYCRCPKGTKMVRARHHLFRICKPVPGVKLCPVNKSFHVRYKCKCPKGTRFGAVSAAYRMCKTLVPPSCGVNRQFKAGTYCRCPKGTKMVRARHHLFRICKK